LKAHTIATSASLPTSSTWVVYTCAVNSITCSGQAVTFGKAVGPKVSRLALYIALFKRMVKYHVTLYKKYN